MERPNLATSDGMPKFAYNFLGAVTTIASEERLPAGPATLVYEFAWDGRSPGAGGLLVDGKQVGP